MWLVVILSGTKDLFQGEREILRGACPELNDETLRFTQGDKRRDQNDMLKPLNDRRREAQNYKSSMW